ncbi:protein transport protein Sec61 subunit gamma isoform X2 [Cricetulus griseus]|uniref:Protein transport protein Sec61 subunit gamma isoform X2 n=1 Tax=Cricetulus griseus TaxID=10029 RepID=A0A9J7HB11_CRIGR|nr:protein transport protein Sec61 subunit gamma isoform X2 [Cricetulus griseus]XP_035311700.1 protein transport protein Sec61 subunit gamma isoform X2 [Cricetulus griseus]
MSGPGNDGNEGWGEGATVLTGCRDEGEGAIDEPGGHELRPGSCRIRTSPLGWIADGQVDRDQIQAQDLPVWPQVEVSSQTCLEELSTMDQVMQFVEPSRQFVKDSIRLVKRCTKPDRKGLGTNSVIKCC